MLWPVVVHYSASLNQCFMSAGLFMSRRKVRLCWEWRGHDFDRRITHVLQRRGRLINYILLEPTHRLCLPIMPLRPQFSQYPSANEKLDPVLSLVSVSNACFWLFSSINNSHVQWLFKLLWCVHLTATPIINQSDGADTDECGSTLCLNTTTI